MDGSSFFFCCILHQHEKDLKNNPINIVEPISGHSITHGQFEIFEFFLEHGGGTASDDVNGRPVDREFWANEKFPPKKIGQSEHCSLIPVPKCARGYDGDSRLSYALSQSPYIPVPAQWQRTAV